MYNLFIYEKRKKEELKKNNKKLTIKMKEQNQNRLVNNYQERIKNFIIDVIIFYMIIDDDSWTFNQNKR